MNNVCLIGRITKDPELRYTPNGVAVGTFTLAVDRDYKDAEGKEQTDFINCVAWNKDAEYMANWVKKGYLLAISGFIQTRNFESSQDGKTYVTEVVVRKVKNLTAKDKTEKPKEEKKEINDGNLPF